MTATPLLLQLAAGRKVRPRKAPVYRPRETKLHCDVVHLLADHCLPEWQWRHIGAKAANAREGAIMKRMGVKRGWPDFILVSARKTCFLELKRAGEEIEDGSDQDDFRFWCIRYGVAYVVARTIDDVLSACDAWGCLRVRVVPRTPDLIMREDIA